MATTNAARAGGVRGRLGGLVPGDRADIVQYHFNSEQKTISIHATYLSGEKVFQA
jgi:imidazolonepropionase-like amidohydrolase